MSTETTKSASGLYYSVIDGTFRRRVQEGTPGAVRREYETKDGAKAEKFEMVIDALEGTIEEMGIHDGDFGRTLNIKLDPNSEGINPVLQFNVETNYGEDVLKKLPGADLSKPIKFRPFAFTDQTNGKDVRGVELKQGDKSLKNYFWDADQRVPLHGLPEVPEGTETKDDWKIHFLNVRKFLIKYFTDNLVNKVQTKKVYTEELSPKDVPF